MPALNLTDRSKLGDQFADRRNVLVALDNRGKDAETPIGELKQPMHRFGDRMSVGVNVNDVLVPVPAARFDDPSDGRPHGRRRCVRPASLPGSYRHHSPCFGC